MDRFAIVLYQGRNFRNVASRMGVITNLLSALKGKSQTVYLYESDNKMFVIKPLMTEVELTEALKEKSPIENLSNFPNWQQSFSFTASQV